MTHVYLALFASVRKQLTKRAIGFSCDPYKVYSEFAHAYTVY